MDTIASNFSAIADSIEYAFSLGHSKSSSTGKSILTGQSTISSPKPTSICVRTRVFSR